MQDYYEEQQHCPGEVSCAGPAPKGLCFCPAVHADFILEDQVPEGELRGQRANLPLLCGF